MRYFWIVVLVLIGCSQKSEVVKLKKPVVQKTKKTDVFYPKNELYTLDRRSLDRFNPSCSALLFRESVLYENIKNSPLEIVESLNYIDKNIKRRCKGR
jgi:hypothetical protein